MRFFFRVYKTAKNRLSKFEMAKNKNKEEIETNYKARKMKRNKKKTQLK